MCANASLHVFLYWCVQEKVAALLQLATLTDLTDPLHMNGTGLKHQDQPASLHARSMPSPVSRTSSSSSPSPLPKQLQRLPSTLWQKLLEGQSMVRQQLGLHGYNVTGSPRDNGEHRHQQGRRYHHYLLQPQPQGVAQHPGGQLRNHEQYHGEEGSKGSRAAWLLGEEGCRSQEQGQEEYGEQQQGHAEAGGGGEQQQVEQEEGEVGGGHGEGVDLLQRLQRAAELIQGYKASLKGFSSSIGGVSPRRGGNSSSSSKGGGGAGLQGSVLGLRPGVQQLHEELQQRW